MGIICGSLLCFFDNNLQKAELNWLVEEVHNRTCRSST